MNSTQKKSGTSAKSITGGAKHAADTVRKKAQSVRTAAAKRTQSSRRVKQARATSRKMPGRAMRFLKSTPLRVFLGASAAVFAAAKLKQYLGS